MTILVAGIGNLFLGDDGFGPEVVRRLPAAPGPAASVRVVDYGIRGMHLAYDLLDGYDALVLVDAVPGASAPGEVTVLEVGPDDLGGRVTSTRTGWTRWRCSARLEPTGRHAAADVRRRLPSRRPPRRASASATPSPPPYPSPSTRSRGCVDDLLSAPRRA